MGATEQMGNNHHYLQIMRPLNGGMGESWEKVRIKYDLDLNVHVLRTRAITHQMDILLIRLLIPTKKC